MDLLSNSIAAYAHIKGESDHSNCPVLMISIKMFFFYFSKPREPWPVLCAWSVFRPGAHTLPPGHSHFMQAANQDGRLQP